ncbi:MAG: hypothetical protein ACFFCS_29580 [Candidatus Hodarchaeota archaeon]
MVTEKLSEAGGDIIINRDFMHWGLLLGGIAGFSVTIGFLTTIPSFTDMKSGGIIAFIFIICLFSFMTLLLLYLFSTKERITVYTNEKFIEFDEKSWLYPKMNSIKRVNFEDIEQFQPLPGGRINLKTKSDKWFFLVFSKINNTDNEQIKQKIACILGFHQDGESWSKIEKSCLNPGEMDGELKKGFTRIRS